MYVGEGTMLKILMIVVLIAASSVAAFYLSNSAMQAETKPNLMQNSRTASAKVAPELAQGEWMNSEPLTLTALKGRVVYLEFWTFGCSNCINTLPTVKRFHSTYASKGLTVIGIQTPEFEHEKKAENIRAALIKRGIEYPVLTDNDLKNWDAYEVNAWPTIVILDKNGNERYRHVGEGAYAEQEQVIKELLAE